MKETTGTRLFAGRPEEATCTHPMICTLMKIIESIVCFTANHPSWRITDWVYKQILRQITDFLNSVWSGRQACWISMGNSMLNTHEASNYHNWLFMAWLNWRLESCGWNTFSVRGKVYSVQDPVGILLSGFVEVRSAVHGGSHPRSLPPTQKAW